LSHLVKCAICNQTFDRDKIQAVKHGARRYSHFECEPNGEIVPLPKKDEDLEKLLNYINKLFHGNQNQIRVNQSIKKFHNEYNYSYSGMLKALIYFFEIKGNSIDKANNSISIIPYVYQDAYRYYYSLYIANLQNQEKDVKEITSKVKEISIPIPQITLRKRFFNVEVEDE
jgi:hypothetical protein